MWIKDADPTESGYYMTYYFHHDHDLFFYKAFWYDVKTSQWIHRFPPDVKQWWNVRRDYYVPCQMQEDIPFVGV